jgi:hypothetical protein
MQGDIGMSSQWTPDAIRALGATTDLPTLGSIFGLGRWRSYQMAHTGECRWEESLRERAALDPHSPVPLLDNLLARFRDADGRWPASYPLVALCAAGPDHAHQSAVLASVGHHVGGAAVGACGLTVHAPRTRLANERSQRTPELAERTPNRSLGWPHCATFNS